MSLNQDAGKITDASWLKHLRSQMGMSQSNIVTFLEMTTNQNVNPGRIAEIETGKRCIPPEWRQLLDILSEKVCLSPSSQRNWREIIYLLRGVKHGV